MHEIPCELLEAVRNEKAVLFAGAGISYNALKVGGLELRNWVGMEIQKNFPEYEFGNRSLEEVCDEFEAVSDRSRLVDFLASQIPHDVEPLPSHTAAVETFRFIITTNWDLLFESAYRKMRKRYQILTSEEDAPQFDYDKRNLLKIHGSIDRPASLICTTEDYQGYADTHPQLLDRVGDLVYDHVVLFVGYGLHDDHLRRLLYQIRRKRGNLIRRFYAVGFYGSVRTKLLESWKVTVIPADAEHFLPQLEQGDAYDAKGKAKKVREEIYEYVAAILDEVSQPTALEMRMKLNEFHIPRLKTNVIEIKKMLHKAGLYSSGPGEDDGFSDEISREFIEAVRSFQDSRNMADADGIVGPKTIRDLQKATAGCS